MFCSLVSSLKPEPRRVGGGLGLSLPCTEPHQPLCLAMQPCLSINLYTNIQYTGPDKCSQVGVMCQIPYSGDGKVCNLAYKNSGA